MLSLPGVLVLLATVSKQAIAFLAGVLQLLQCWIVAVWHLCLW
jgi:hypothetical protein